jgi:hypothetical protein
VSQLQHTHRRELLVEALDQGLVEEAAVVLELQVPLEVEILVELAEMVAVELAQLVMEPQELPTQVVAVEVLEILGDSVDLVVQELLSSRLQ